MTPLEVRQHSEHLCDVWAEDSDGNVVAYGVIDQRRNGYALVTGHPEYPDRWVDYSGLHTACKITERGQ